MTPSAGVRDNRELEARADVLVFTSEPLAGPVEILGEVAAELSVARDNPNADLFVRLCDVDEKGRSRNVCDGIVRLTAADTGDGVVRISLLGAAHRFGPGHRLRLQVSGGAHPRFAPQPGHRPGRGARPGPGAHGVPDRPGCLGAAAACHRVNRGKLCYERLT